MFDKIIHVCFSSKYDWSLLDCCNNKKKYEENYTAKFKNVLTTNLHKTILMILTGVGRQQR